MRGAVAATLLLSATLSAHAQVQPFTLQQTEGPIGGPTRDLTTIRSARGSLVVVHHVDGATSAPFSPRIVTRADLGKRFLISEESNLISTYLLTPRELTALTTPKSSPGCDPGSGATLNGQEHLLGVLVFRYDSLLRGGSEKHSSWYAPSLDCRAIQYKVSALDAGGWKLIFSRVPRELDLDAVSDSAFFVPSFHREVPPSEHQKADIARKRGAPFGLEPNDAAMARELERLDRHYHESRQATSSQ